MLLPDHAAEIIAVGSPAWYAWLVDATSFVLRSRHGTFTAYKERRGTAQEYWRAYRRRADRLQCVYLGESGELTLDRLNASAAGLGNKISAQAPAGNATLLVPIVGHLDSRRAEALTGRLLEQAYTQHARLVILDIAGVSVGDTAVAHALLQDRTRIAATRLHGLSQRDCCRSGDHPGAARGRVGGHYRRT